jgi:TrmH family RNA methyltransferase
VLQSRDNPKVRRWRALAHDGAARRAEGRAIIEGPHLVEAWAAHRGPPICILLASGATLQDTGAPVVLLSEAAMRAITDVRTPQGVAAEVAIPRPAGRLSALADCVFLDAVQDAGNVGAILRSASAFGLLDIVLGPGCADAWSPKVLRAAAGAHAVLRLRETDDLVASFEEFSGNIYCTAPRDGTPLDELDYKSRLAWVFGSEGQGVRAEIARHTTGAASIPMPGRAESLNVAAAAAVCFYEHARRRNPQ